MRPRGINATPSPQGPVPVPAVASLDWFPPSPYLLAQHGQALALLAVHWAECVLVSPLLQHQGRGVSSASFTRVDHGLSSSMTS